MQDTILHPPSFPPTTSPIHPRTRHGVNRVPPQWLCTRRRSPVEVSVAGELKDGLAEEPRVLCWWRLGVVGGVVRLGLGLGIQSASPVRRPPHLQIEGRGFVPRRVVPEPAGEVPPVEGVPHGHALCGSCAVVWVPISRLPIQLHANTHTRARCDAIPPAGRPAGWAWRAPRGSHTCRRGS